MCLFILFFFFKQKTAYEMLRSLVGSEMCIRDRPDGERVTLAIEWAERVRQGCARAAVVKDAGDDPDVTDGMTVVAEVEVAAAADAVAARPPAVGFVAGPGVGTVTRAGLQIPPGEPAINPVPRRMIAAAVRAVLPDEPVRVTVSIPGGEQAARRTFNERLGVVGGLSVLGTSGRVIPRSEDAWMRSLLPQVDVALADGNDTVYLTPGGFGERAARERFGAAETQIVQCSNFVGDLLDRCVDAGMAQVVLVGHAGKLVKVAAGVWNTHSRVADARLETLAALAAAAGAPPTLVVRILELPTAEAAVDVLADAGLDEVWDDVAERAARRASERAARRAGDGAAPRCDCAVVAYDDHTLVYFHKEPLASNVWNLNFPVIPKHIFEKSLPDALTLAKSEYHQKQDENPVTGGPYTISRRVRMAFGFLSRRSCAASSTCSCSQRLMRRCVVGVHFDLSGQCRHAFVQ